MIVVAAVVFFGVVSGDAHVAATQIEGNLEVAATFQTTRRTELSIEDDARTIDGIEHHTGQDNLAQIDIVGSLLEIVLCECTLYYSLTIRLYHHLDLIVEEGNTLFVRHLGKAVGGRSFDADDELLIVERHSVTQLLRSVLLHTVFSRQLVLNGVYFIRLSVFVSRTARSKQKGRRSHKQCGKCRCRKNFYLHNLSIFTKYYCKGNDYFKINA